MYILIHFYFNFTLFRYLYFVLQTRLPVELDKLKQGNTMPYIKVEMIKDFEIPLPPIEVQQQIVDDLEGYQKIIDGCRQVVENYKPTIDIDPSWEVVELGELATLKYGLVLPPKAFHSSFVPSDIEACVDDNLNPIAVIFMSVTLISTSSPVIEKLPF